MSRSSNLIDVAETGATSVGRNRYQTSPSEGGTSDTPDLEEFNGEDAETRPEFIHVKNDNPADRNRKAIPNYLDYTYRIFPQRCYLGLAVFFLSQDRKWIKRNNHNGLLARGEIQPVPLGYSPTSEEEIWISGDKYPEDWESLFLDDHEKVVVNPEGTKGISRILPDHVRALKPSRTSKARLSPGLLARVAVAAQQLERTKQSESTTTTTQTRTTNQVQQPATTVSVIVPTPTPEARTTIDGKVTVENREESFIDRTIRQGVTTLTIDGRIETLKFTETAEQRTEDNTRLEHFFEQEEDKITMKKVKGMDFYEYDLEQQPRWNTGYLGKFATKDVQNHNGPFKSTDIMGRNFSLRVMKIHSYNFWPIVFDMLAPLFCLKSYGSRWCIIGNKPYVIMPRLETELVKIARYYKTLDTDKTIPYEIRRASIVRMREELYRYILLLACCGIKRIRSNDIYISDKSHVFMLFPDYKDLKYSNLNLDVYIDPTLEKIIGHENLADSLHHAARTLTNKHGSFDNLMIKIREVLRLRKLYDSYFPIIAGTFTRFHDVGMGNIANNVKALVLNREQEKKIVTSVAISNRIETGNYRNNSKPLNAVKKMEFDFIYCRIDGGRTVVSFRQDIEDNIWYLMPESGVNQPMSFNIKMGGDELESHPANPRFEMTPWPNTYYKYESCPEYREQCERDVITMQTLKYRSSDAHERRAQSEVAKSIELVHKNQSPLPHIPDPAAELPKTEEETRPPPSELEPANVARLFNVQIQAAPIPEPPAPIPEPPAPIPEPPAPIPEPEEAQVEEAQVEEAQVEEAQVEESPAPVPIPESPVPSPQPPTEVPDDKPTKAPVFMSPVMFQSIYKLDSLGKNFTMICKGDALELYYRTLELVNRGELYQDIPAIQTIRASRPVTQASTPRVPEVTEVPSSLPIPDPILQAPVSEPQQENSPQPESDSETETEEPEEPEEPEETEETEETDSDSDSDSDSEQEQEEPAPVPTSYRDILIKMLKHTETVTSEIQPSNSRSEWSAVFRDEVNLIELRRFRTQYNQYIKTSKSRIERPIGRSGLSLIGDSRSQDVRRIIPGADGLQIPSINIHNRLRSKFRIKTPEATTEVGTMTLNFQYNDQTYFENRDIDTFEISTSEDGMRYYNTPQFCYDEESIMEDLYQKNSPYYANRSMWLIISIGTQRNLGAAIAVDPIFGCLNYVEVPENRRHAISRALISSQDCMSVPVTVYPLSLILERNPHLEGKAIAITTDKLRHKPIPEPFAVLDSATLKYEFQELKWK